MAKEAISATIEKTTADAVRKIAQKEKRSFSQMVELLILKALGKA